MHRTWEAFALEERSSTVASQKSLSSAVSSNQVNKAASAAETQAAAKTMPALSELTEEDGQNLFDLIDSIVGGERMLVPSLWTHLRQKQRDKLVVKDAARARTVSQLSTASFLCRSRFDNIAVQIASSSVVANDRRYEERNEVYDGQSRSKTRFFLLCIQARRVW